MQERSPDRRAVDSSVPTSCATRHEVASAGWTPPRRWTSTKAKDTTMSDSSTPDRPKAGDDTMWALRAPERGGPEQLRFERAPIPSVDADEVLVAVHAAAITFDELLWDETWQPLPAVPSHEVSGVVAAVGADVTAFAPGDEVYGLIRFDRQG